MKCPVCPESSLLMTERQGVEIDYCPQCRGVWLDTDSVEFLPDAMESFVNRASAIFALMMVTVAQRPADEEHAYGHHQVKHFSSGLEGTPIVDGTGVY